MSEFDRKKWNSKYREQRHSTEHPAPTVVQLESYLPTHGRALDLAGGTGRHAIWLAQRGLDVTLADISEVGLTIAQERAAEHGVSISTLPVDLEEQSLPAGPWDVILSHYFLCRDLFPQFTNLLAPAGILIVVQPTMKNLERNAKPPKKFLFENDELRTLAAGFNVLHYTESWTPKGVHEAVLVAQRSP